MHSHQSYPNLTTGIHSYEHIPTIDISTIKTYTSRGVVGFTSGVRNLSIGKMYKSELDFDPNSFVFLVFHLRS